MQQTNRHKIFKCTITEKKGNNNVERIDAKKAKNSKMKNITQSVMLKVLAIVNWMQ